MGVSLDDLDDDAPKEATKSTKEGKAEAPSGALPSFMMTGQNAQAAYAKEEAIAKKRQEEAAKLWRFMIPQDEIGKDYLITFMDGDLDKDGMLVMPTWHEHTIQLNGSWENLVCISGKEPCPMCEQNNNRALVGGFSVVDHTPYKVKKGPNAGKVIEKSRKLFIPKRTTVGVLQKIAAKRGGLKGLTIEVSRTGAKAPNVGDAFDVVKKQELSEVIAELKAKGFDKALWEPTDWSKEITYRDRAALEELGVVGSGTMVGGAKPSKDLSEEL